jgi:hypothetical protein
VLYPPKPTRATPSFSFFFGKIIDGNPIADAATKDPVVLRKFLLVMEWFIAGWVDLEFRTKIIKLD